MQLRRPRAAPKPLDTAANAVWYCCRRRTFVTCPTRLTVDVTSMAMGQSGGDGAERRQCAGVLGGQSVERAQQVGGGVSQEMSSSARAADRRRCCIRNSGRLAAPRGRGASSALGGFGDFGGIGRAISASLGGALWRTLFCVQIHHFDGKHEHNLERGDVVTILRRVARRRQRRCMRQRSHQKLAQTEPKRLLF